MADYASKTRLHGTTRGWKGRHYEPTGQVALSSRQLRQDEWWYSGCVSNASIASASCSHTCHSTLLEDFRDTHLFESVIMTNCMRKINNEVVRNYREKPIDEQLAETHPPFLFEVSRRGSGEGEVLYPRSVSCSLTGDIVVADSDNNRIQIYNGYGIWKDCLNLGGSVFKGPTVVAMSANKQSPNVAAVIDSSTNIYVVDTERLAKICQLQVGYRPASVGWTVAGHLLAVRPPSGSLRPGHFTVDVFSLPRKEPSKITPPALTLTVEAPFPSRKLVPFAPILQPFFGDENCFFIAQRSNECIACVDLQSRKVRFRIQLSSPFDGLAVDMIDFAADPERPNVIVAADQCNRFLLSCQFVTNPKNRAATTYPTEVICRPRDGIGQLRRCAVSPWGHAIGAEYGQDLESEEEISKSRDKTTRTPHRLTVFRVPYRQCRCHDWQPVKQHKMDATIYIRDPTERSTLEVRRAGVDDPYPVPWQRQFGLDPETETRFLDINRAITPDPADPTPDPLFERELSSAVLIDELGSPGPLDEDGERILVSGQERETTSVPLLSRQSGEMTSDQKLHNTEVVNSSHPASTSEAPSTRPESASVVPPLAAENEEDDYGGPKTVIIIDPALIRSKPNTPAATTRNSDAKVNTSPQ